LNKLCEALATLVPFDLLHREGEDLRLRPIETRREALIWASRGSRRNVVGSSY
jgi:ATP-dependent DNA ligase